MKKFKKLFKILEFEEEAIWAGDKTIEEFVEQCPKGEWLFWVAYKIDIDWRSMALAMGHCINLVRHHLYDSRSIRSVDMAIAYGEGKIPYEDYHIAYSIANDVDVVRLYFGNYINDKINRKVAATFAASKHPLDGYAAARAVAYTGETDIMRNLLQMSTADICRKYIGSLIVEKINEMLSSKINETNKN
jgi:hypothetical protein